MVTITVRRTPPSQRKYKIGGSGLKAGSYKTSSGKTIIVRNTPESERKYKMPVSDQGQKLNYSGGVVTTAGGKIIGTYEESAQPEKVTSDSAVANKLKSSLENKNYFGTKEPIPTFTPAPNVSTRYGQAYAEQKNGNTTLYLTQEGLAKAKTESANLEKKRSFTPSGFISEAPKKSGVIEFGKGVFTGGTGDILTAVAGTEFYERQAARQRLSELWGSREKATPYQVGSVVNIGLSVGTFGALSYGKTTYSVGQKTFTTFGSAFNSARKGRNIYETGKAIIKTTAGYSRGGFPIGTVTYAPPFLAGIYGVTKTYKKASYAVSSSDELGLSYEARQEIFGKAERSGGVQLSKSFSEVSSAKDFGVYAKQTAQTALYPVSTLFSGKEGEARFTESAKTQLLQRGYTEEEALKLSKGFAIERRGGGLLEIGTAIGAEVGGEFTGRRAITTSVIAMGAKSFTKKEAFRSSFKLSAKSLFIPGAIEGVGQYISTTQLRSEKFKPTEAVFYGVAGGTSASTLGGILGGMTTRTSITPTTTRKVTTKTYSGLLYVSDAPEYFGDRATDVLERQFTKIKGYDYQKVYTVSGYTKSNTFTFGVSGFTPSNSVTKNTVYSRTNIFNQAIIKSTTKTTTPTQVVSFTKTPTITKTATTINVPSFSFTPVVNPASVPTNVPTSVPTTVPALPFPIFPIPEFGKTRGFGRPEAGRSLRRTAYVPSLSFGLFGLRGKSSGSVLTGFEIRAPRKTRKKSRR